MCTPATAVHARALVVLAVRHAGGGGEVLGLNICALSSDMDKTNESITLSDHPFAPRCAKRLQ